ncbi:MAG: GntR family transcriptional regulator [Clostridiales bacterium]|nr:GntR family transcriptional regulator [Clostridiales bacterium]
MAYTVSEKLCQYVKEGMEHNPFAVLSRLVYEGIYREITEGRLTIDDSVNMSKFAEALGISRTPVSIAVNDLIKDGLMEKRKDNRLTVKKITSAEVSQLYEARLTIEVECAYLAARRITDPELERLRKILEGFQRADETEDLRLYIQCDKKFHDVVVAAARNRLLAGAYSCLEGLLQCYRYQNLKYDYKTMCHRNGVQDEMDYHRCIYESLRSHMPMEAKNAMFRDVERMHATMFMVAFS